MSRGRRRGGRRRGGRRHGGRRRAGATHAGATHARRRRRRIGWIHRRRRHPARHTVVNMPPGQEQQQLFAYSKYPKRKSQLVGVMQIAMAVLLIFLNLGQALIETGTSYWAISSGWWATPFMILAGSFGIAAGMEPNNCRISSTLSLSCFSALTIVVVLTQAGLSLSNGRSHDSTYLAANVLFIIVGLAEFGFAMTQSIYCCKTNNVYSFNTDDQPTTQFQTNQAAPQEYHNGTTVQYHAHPQGVDSPQVIVSMPTEQNVAMPTGQYTYTGDQPPSYAAVMQADLAKRTNPSAPHE